MVGLALCAFHKDTALIVADCITWSMPSLRLRVELQSRSSGFHSSMPLPFTTTMHTKQITHITATGCTQKRQIDVIRIRL